MRLDTVPNLVFSVQTLQLVRDFNRQTEVGLQDLDQFEQRVNIFYEYHRKTNFKIERMEKGEKEFQVDYTFRLKKEDGEVAEK